MGCNKKTYESNIIKTTPGKNGYHSITLNVKGEKIYSKVHILIAKTFIENPNNYPQVNHKDENKSNNSVDNLEWCTAKYNMNYGTRAERCAKAQGKRIQQIKDGVVLQTFFSCHEASRQTGINFKNISSVCKGRRNSAGGYEWKYENDYKEVLNE